MRNIAIACVLAVTQFACSKTGGDESLRESAAGLSGSITLSPGVTATVIGATESFDGNVEVEVEFVNKNEAATTLTDVAGSGSKFSIADADGVPHPLHKMSVGSGKPLIIPPEKASAVTRATFLFAGGGVRGSTVKLWGKSCVIEKRPERPFPVEPPAPETTGGKK